MSSKLTPTALPTPPKEYDIGYMDRLVKQIALEFTRQRATTPITCGSDLSGEAGFPISGLTIVNPPVSSTGSPPDGFPEGSVWCDTTSENSLKIITSGPYTDQDSLNLANTTDPALGDALIGFRQSNASGNLTGAVGRTVHEKLQEIVSALDFGADPTGATDSTAALQAAINACFGSVASPNGYALRHKNSALFIPKGTYSISDSLNIRSLIGGKIFGEGRFATTIRQTAANKAVFYTNGCGYTTFSDMCLQCTASNTGAIFDLNWDGTGTVALQSNTFSNIYFIGLPNLSVSKGLAIGVGGYQGSENLISNCFFEALNSGIYVANFNALQNIMIGGNIQACRYGIYVVAGSVTNVYGTGFQNDLFSSGSQVTEGGWDIIVINSVNDQMVIEGCRSEGMRFGFFGNGINAKLSNNSMISSRVQAWVANASYSLGAIIAGTGTPYICTTAGTSGATEPTWSGTTVSDNTVVWTLYNYEVVSGARTFDRNILQFGQISGYDSTTIFTGNFFSRADFLSGTPYQLANGGPLLINNVNLYSYQAGTPRDSQNYNEYASTWTPTYNITLGSLHGLIWPSFVGQTVGFTRGKIEIYSIDQNSISVEGVLAGRSVSGTDVAGKPLYLAGGPGTGTGAPGSIVFRTPTALTTGTTVQDFTTRMTLKGSGVLNMGNATTYADNAAALAGGLVAGDVYKTATGELRIVV